MAIIKIKISALPSASSLSGLYGLGYQSGSSVKIPSNLLKGDTGATGATGPAGATGTNGKNVELQNNGTYIQWRLVGDVTWNNLVTLSTISGKEVELRNNSGQIQWRLTGGSWTNLIDVSALQGPKGEKGDTGATGPQGPAGPMYHVDVTTGTAVEFTGEKDYGTIASPVSGNITQTLTGALVGACITIIHQAASEPTYPATWKKLAGGYNPGGINYIIARFYDNSNVRYIIQNEPI